jgi:hypothetical protein
MESGKTLEKQKTFFVFLFFWISLTCSFKGILYKYYQRQKSAGEGYDIML